MTKYAALKTIIPPDQALANEALSRSLRQVKDIFNADLPTLSVAVSNLESNKDLPLINALTTPIPPAVANVWANTFVNGTGPGGTLTTNDVIGTAAGATHNEQLPVVTGVLKDMTDAGYLNVLIYNDGDPFSANVLGIYTVMNNVLANSYTYVDPFTSDITINIPGPQPGQGSYGPDLAFGNVASLAFANLIVLANTAIATIASTYTEYSTTSNQATSAMAAQLALNTENCILAGIDIGNVVNDINNANLIANSVSTSLNLVSRLHDIGLDVTAGGQAQFFESIANTNNITGQAVIASMREGRNIAVLNAAGITLDTQLVDVNPNQTMANNLGNAQYSVAEARANIVL